MVAATQTTRFLPFLEPAEESAVLATAPVKSFDRGAARARSERAVAGHLPHRGGDGARRAPRPGPDGPVGPSGGRRVLRRDVLCRWRADECQGHRRFTHAAAGHRRGNRQQSDQEGPRFCRPALSLDRGHPRGAAAADVDASRLRSSKESISTARPAPRSRPPPPSCPVRIGDPAWWRPWSRESGRPTRLDFAVSTARPGSRRHNSDSRRRLPARRWRCMP